MFRESLIYFSTYLGLIAFFFYIMSVRRRVKSEKISSMKLDDKNAPKVTIIIPAYNEEKGIGSTIESALALDYPRNKLEILVIDDGSKDKTYILAKKYESKMVKVFTKKNGGKGTAMNFGLKRATGEFFVTMDADSMVKPDSLRNMIVRFTDPKIMCVSPILAVYNPKGIWQRVQQVEYFLGIFLREVFASLNAIHVTPGAFSAYRMSFIKKYGGFDEDNLTEDLEMALRIQYHHYIIDNCLKAVVFTEAPSNFKALMKQRRRWYGGLVKNLKNYSELFSTKYGALGVFVLPLAVITVVVSLLLTVYFIGRAFIDTHHNFLLWKSINFDFLSRINFGKFSLDMFFFNLFSEPITFFVLIFLMLSLGYMAYAKTKIKEHTNIAISFPLFLFFYSLLFAYWWIVTFIYTLFNREIKWR